MRSRAPLATSFLALLVLAVPVTAPADKGGKSDKHAEKHYQKQQQRQEHEYRKQQQKDEHEYQKREQKAEHEYQKREQKMARFRDDERSRVVSYYRDHYRDGRDCPPGLRKKNNGCQPPGHAKRYSVGRSIESGVSLYPLPHDLVSVLAPAPSGYAYGFLDGDVILYEVPTRVVVDVVVVPF